MIEALRRYFSHLLQVGPFELAAVDWDEVRRDAHQISAGFAARLKARSADALHVAILEQLNPDLFVSGDKDQLALATARGFRSVRFYQAGDSLMRLIARSNRAHVVSHNVKRRSDWQALSCACQIERRELIANIRNPLSQTLALLEYRS